MIKKTIKKKKIFKKSTYKAFIYSESIFENYLKINKQLSSYISFFFKKTKNILEIKSIIIFFKKISYILSQIILKKKKILIIGNTYGISTLLSQQLIKRLKLSKMIFFYKKSWEDGLFSKNKKIYRKLTSKKISFVILLKESENKEIKILKEIRKLKIPVLSFINSSLNTKDYKNITYPLIINKDKIQFFFFFLFYFKQLVNKLLKKKKKRKYKYKLRLKKKWFKVKKKSKIFLILKKNKYKLKKKFI